MDSWRTTEQWRHIEAIPTVSQIGSTNKELLRHALDLQLQGKTHPLLQMFLGDLSGCSLLMFAGWNWVSFLCGLCFRCSGRYWHPRSALRTSRNQLVIANWHGFEQPVKQTIYEQLVSEPVCPNQPVERVLVIVLTTYFMYGATWILYI